MCKIVPAAQRIPIYVQITKYSSPVARSVHIYLILLII